MTIFEKVCTLIYACALNFTFIALKLAQFFSNPFISHFEMIHSDVDNYFSQCVLYASR